MFGKREKPFMTDDRLDHVAIVMDGNGRWAKRRMLPRTAGHRAGAAAVSEVLSTLREIGVHTVTLYAFSTENWKRPAEEVDGIMAILSRYIDEVVMPKIREDGELSVRFLGDLSALPAPLAEKCRTAEDASKGGSFCVQVALNYGGRDEIVKAANDAFRECGAPITKESLAAHLYTAGKRDPDLLIRTGGDLRLSNYLLWQCAYTEFYFTKTLFPDFGREEILRAVADFYQRKRRFGGLDKEDIK